MLILVVFVFCISGLNAIIYDCYTGKPVTKRQMDGYIQRNVTEYCVINLKPCDPNDWRRTDGSCNNLKYPSRGMVRTPTIRVLPPDFSPNYEPRKAKDGKPLPLARYLRTQLLKTGKSTDIQLTVLVSYYLLFGISDMNSLHDIFNYVGNTTNCCLPEGQSNYICAPNKMPVDDPVHRYSGIKCQNLTKPQSLQYYGCADFGTTQFTRLSFATPLIDLSGTYSNDIGGTDELRTFHKGLLKIEIENGKVFPPRNPNFDIRVNNCGMNQLPKETRCHRYQLSGALGSNLLMILYYRQHNYIATKLAELNPCWDDHRLFYTAKDINNAIHTQIYFYELLPVVLGRSNMIRDGVISWSKGFRDLYNKNIPPQVTDEFIYINRWFHNAQETELKLYDTDGYYLRTVPIVNFTTRTGILPVGNYIEQFFQNSFRQLSAKFDDTIDYDMAERVLGSLQEASDVATNDLVKGRLFGFPPYYKYREYCARRPCRTFDCLKDVMTPEKIYRLQQCYGKLEDIDLMAGAWVEKLIPGGRVPYTMYCLMVEHLRRAVVSDRHWYERSNRPHAFTFKQLQAIRKATVAGLLCTNADGVTKIQPNAFYRISFENPLTDCNSPDIGNIDLSPWKDPGCAAVCEQTFIDYDFFL